MSQDSFIVTGDANTPAIMFIPSENTYSIKGRSIVSETDKHFSLLVEWLEKFQHTLPSKFEVNFEIECMNIGSGKKFLNVFYKLDEIFKTGKDIRINWFFKKNDDEMYETGHDFSVLVSVPFDLKVTSSVTKTEAQLA